MDRHRVDDVIVRFLSGFPGWALSTLRAVHSLDAGLAFTFTPSLFCASLLLPLGFVARLVAVALEELAEEREDESPIGEERLAP